MIDPNYSPNTHALLSEEVAALRKSVATFEYERKCAEEALRTVTIQEAELEKKLRDRLAWASRMGLTL